MLDSRYTILFICTGNAARSQMAETLARHLVDDHFRIVSAGVDPWVRVHPMVVRLMTERGLNTAGQYPKPVKDFATTPLDLIVTIGDRARDETPDLPGNPRRIYWNIDDPVEAEGTPRAELAFRDAQKEIEVRLPKLVEIAQTAARARTLNLLPGISTCIIRPNRFEPAIHMPLLAKAGFQCIELNCSLGHEDFLWDAPEKIHDLKCLARETGVNVFGVHALGEWLPFAEKEGYQSSLDTAKRFADTAAELGALYVVVHAGLPQAYRRREALRMLKKVLQDLQAHVESMPCRFAWENEALGLSAREHCRHLNALNPNAFALLLDTGHAHIRHDAAEYFALAGPRLCSLHFHDNDGHDDLHRLPGRGTINWAEFAAGLRQCTYTGPLILEVEARDRQDDLPSTLRDAMSSITMLQREISTKA